MNGKKLYRSRDNRMLGGVCMGIAEYIDFDVTFTLYCSFTLLRRDDSPNHPSVLMTNFARSSSVIDSISP